MSWPVGRRGRQEHSIVNFYHDFVRIEVILIIREPNHYSATFSSAWPGFILGMEVEYGYWFVKLNAFIYVFLYICETWTMPETPPRECCPGDRSCSVWSIWKVHLSLRGGGGVINFAVAENRTETNRVEPTLRSHSKLLVASIFISVIVAVEPGGDEDSFFFLQ